MDEVEAFHAKNRITDPRVIRFYNANPDVSFERMNEALVVLLESARLEANPAEGAVAKEMRDFREKIAEQQRLFLEKLRSDAVCSNAESADRASLALAKYADALSDRLTLLLPKTAEDAHAKLQLQLQMLQTTLQKDLRDVLLATKGESFGEFAAAFDAKMTALQQPLLTVLHAGQETVSAKLGAVKEDQLLQKAGFDRLSASFHEYLQKQAGSHFKGAQSEVALEERLTRLFPTAAVARTTGFTGCGDFKLDRGAPLPVIMLENKNYSENVKNTEVQKFVRDATALGCSAILLSQHSGVVGKRDFEIEIDNGNVLVYLHHADQHETKLVAAVAVIDALASRLKNIVAAEDTDGSFFPKDVLDAINAEVQAFVQKKNALITSLKESHKRTVAQIEEFHFPELFKILSEKYASPEAKAYACAECARTFESKRALSAHAQRSHPK